MSRTKIPRNVITEILTEAGYRCAVPTCRNILAIDMHHIVEVKDGGPNDQSNLLALCPTCHALYTRGTISRESINVWKTMLVALNHAFDQESISNLLFLKRVSDETNKRIETINKGDNPRKKLNIDKDGSWKLYSGAEMDLKLLIVSGDGVLKFSHLIASGFATFAPASITRGAALYYILLTPKGQRIVEAWFSDNRNDVREALVNLPQD